MAFVSHGYAVLTINYRMVGESVGPLSSVGPIIDAATALAYCVHILNVQPQRIVLFGHSIGGAFAAETATLFPQVYVVSDRSFDSLTSVSWVHVGGDTLAAYLQQFRNGPAVVRVLQRSVALFLRYLACWHLDASHHWKAVAQDRKCVLYATMDMVIPPHVQLATHAREHAARTGEEGVMLHLRAGSRERDMCHHNRALTNTELAAVLRLIKDYAATLQEASAQPLAAGSSGDAGLASVAAATTATPGSSPR